MAKIRSTSNKENFIALISSMSDTDINEYIKIHGKPPKKVEMIQVIDKEKRSLEEWMTSLSK